MMSQESSLAPSCTPALPAAQLQIILLSPIVGTDSAFLTPSNAGHVQPVLQTGGTVMAGVCITTVLQQHASSVAALVLLIRRVLAPHVPSLLSRPRRRSAVDNVRTFLLLHPHARIVLLPPLMNLANSSVEQTAGSVAAQFWRSGDSVRSPRRIQQQQQQQKLHQQQLPAVWVEQ